MTPIMNSDESGRLLERISDAVFDMDEEAVADAVNEYIEAGGDPYDGMMRGLVDGMNRASRMYDENEYFITELLFCADAMNKGIDMLRPLLTETKEPSVRRKIVIGVIEGDIHDIGKNLVRIMLEASGFEMTDLGKDVTVANFIDTAIRENADIIAMSTMMTTTMYNMRELIDELKKRGLRDRFKVIVGGGPVSQAFADEIGADGYSQTATEVVTLAHKLTE